MMGLRSTLRRWTRGAVKGLVGGMLVVSLCALPDGRASAAAIETPGAVKPAQTARTPGAAKPATPTVKKAVPPHALKNPHLRPTSTTTLPAAKTKRTVKPLHVSSRQPRAVFHRGYGTITGTVRDATNRPVAGAHVHLRKPGGRAFRSRRAQHNTISNSAGGFTMHRVKPRAYHVGAIKKKVGKGFVNLRLTAAAPAAPVLIKFGASSPSRRRHK
jgi:hypothetical protein